MDPRFPGNQPPGSPQPFGQPFGQAGGPVPPKFGEGFGPNPSNAYAPPNMGNSPYGNAFGDPRFPQQPPPRKSLWWLWLLLGGGSAFVLLLCCGGFGLVYFGFNIIEQELTPQLQNDPVVQEHIGDVKSVEFDFMKSIQEAEKSGEDDALVFHIEGTKGAGDVIGRSETKPDGGERLEGGILRLSTGEEFQLSE